GQLEERAQGDSHARRPPSREHEVILVTTKASQQLVASCCAASRSAGVRPGMTVAHARALLRSPILVDYDPHGDRLALERLARWAMRFSPAVGVDTGSVEEEGQEPDSILIDISGCERVFHGEECLLGLISASLAGLRLHHRLGVAPTIGA